MTNDYRWWQCGAHPRLWTWIEKLHDRGGWRWRLFFICAAPLFMIEAIAAPVVSRIWPNRKTPT